MSWLKLDKDNEAVDQVVHFGKYKGRTWGEVLCDDPDYIVDVAAVNPKIIFSMRGGKKLLLHAQCGEQVNFRYNRYRDQRLRTISKDYP